ncbi:MAG: hypothetical protein ACRDD1_06855, partial [Planctomycetia bacterium]
SGGYPLFLENVGGVLFFNASDGTNGDELWKSDGTADGTVRLTGDFLDGGSDGPTNITNVVGVVYFSANDGQFGNELWRYFADVEADPIVFGFAPKNASQGQPVLIDLNIALTDVDGSETLTVTIGGVPIGSSFTKDGSPVGFDMGDGNWRFAANELAGLTLLPVVSFIGELNLSVTAVSVDDFFTVNPREGRTDVPRTRTETQTITLIAAEVSRPIVTAGTATGQAGQGIPLPISVTVPTGDDFLMQINGVPATVLLSAGFRLGTGSPIYLVNSGDLANLSFLAPAGLPPGEFRLSVFARNLVTQSESEIREIVVTVAPIGGQTPAPGLAVLPAGGVVGRPIPLLVTVTAPPLAAGQRVRVLIDGVPIGALLSAGDSLGGGTWSLTVEQTVGLTLTLPPNSIGGRIDLVVTAEVLGADGRSLNSVETRLLVDVARGNTAPRFGAGRPRLNSVTGRNGVLVRSLLTGAGDAEQRRLGAAVVGLKNAGRGRWQFKTTGAWKNVTGRLSDRRALLLGSTARLRFVAAAGAAPGKLEVKLRAWDLTTGAAGRFARATPNGGATAFSAAVRTIRGTPPASAAEPTPRSTKPSLLAAALLDAVFTAVDD